MSADERGPVQQFRAQPNEAAEPGASAATAGGFAARLEQILPGLAVDPVLLELALTHRSWAYENGGTAHNERLEFLGDSVLGLAVTARLFREQPDASEGELARRRSALVSATALAEVARRIGLGEHIRLGRGEELTGGRQKQSILADTVEAVIGAVFEDQGPAVAERFVLALVGPLFDEVERFGAAMDPKTALQELAAARGLPAPRYEVEGSGPDHNRVFAAVVRLGEVEGRGAGASKKAAEAAAAMAAWTLAQPAKPAEGRPGEAQAV